MMLHNEWRGNSTTHSRTSSREKTEPCLTPPRGPTLRPDCVCRSVMEHTFHPQEQNRSDAFTGGVFSAWILFPELQGICVCNSINLQYYELLPPNRESKLFSYKIWMCLHKSSYNRNHGQTIISRSHDQCFSGSNVHGQPNPPYCGNTTKFRDSCAQEINIRWCHLTFWISAFLTMSW